MAATTLFVDGQPFVSYEYKVLKLSHKSMLVCCVDTKSLSEYFLQLPPEKDVENY